MRAASLVFPDVLLFEPKVFGDERGFFYDNFNKSAYFRSVKDVFHDQSHLIKHVLIGVEVFS
ncbi:dTDP-4-dehydrorhamnose 3,5-epimerase family protein [Pseudomonas simiae]|jgi:dTDP-4-dehydrorhamnose 3,5-epimerase|uniref:dTDP-4-dehydrorhamnose 3,5-epimerase family protein n=1 Tax=Pseudomonas simiae TaxID=321846 RepID=UPI0027357A5D|nr:dTDP-4-dehydrorhamnose 3,5-epimerase family protein [Pseudomonas simiae]WLG32705.1 dTDP-4-dehydrorhamnose 3,5-epimerase family protein [Pseudomonas simiae]WLI22696.1 dTDP-4-dehydrorhamnose 3,5-epimerase family protein [Pseudomonas simiae]